MSSDWEDRIAGLKRIGLALGVMSLCAIMSQQYSAQSANTDPDMVETQNARYEKCAASVRETTLGIFGCAVVLKPKVKASSIRFLSADKSDNDTSRKNRPMFQSADRLK